MELNRFLVCLVLLAGTVYCEDEEEGSTSDVCDVMAIRKCLGGRRKQMTGPASRNVFEVVTNPKEELKKFCAEVQAIERCTEGLFDNCEENEYVMGIEDTLNGYGVLCEEENLNKILEANWCLEASKDEASFCVERTQNLTTMAENDRAKCRIYRDGYDCVSRALKTTCKKDVEELVQYVQELLNEEEMEEISCGPFSRFQNGAAALSFSFIAFSLSAILFSL